MTEYLVFEDKTKGNELKIQLVKTNGRIMIWTLCEKESQEMECTDLKSGREQFSMLVMRMNNEAS